MPASVCDVQHLLKPHPLRHSLYTLVIFFAHVRRGHLETGLLMSRHVVGCADNTCAPMYINRQGAVFDPHSTDLDQRMFPVTQAHTCSRGEMNAAARLTLLLAGKHPGRSTLQVVFLALAAGV